jgi:hypothetical protein
MQVPHMSATVLTAALPTEGQEELAVRLARCQVNEFYRLVGIYRNDSYQLDNLLFMGRMIRMMVDHPDFPDRRVADDVRATCEMLQVSKGALAMTSEEADSILKAAGLMS